MFVNAVRLEMELSEASTSGSCVEAEGRAIRPLEAPDSMSGSAMGPAARQNGRDCENAVRRVPKTFIRFVYTIVICRDRDVMVTSN